MAKPTPASQTAEAATDKEAVNKKNSANIEDSVNKKDFSKEEAENNKQTATTKKPTAKTTKSASTAKDKTQAPVKKQGGTFTLFLAWLALLALGALAYYGFNQLQLIQQQLAQQNSAQQATNKQTENQAASLNSLHILQQQQQSLLSNLEENIQLLNQPPSHLYLVLEIEHLVKLAALNLDFGQNPKLAQELLETALARLKTSSLPTTFNAVTKDNLKENLSANLTADVHKLEQLEIVAKPELAKQLQNLAAQAFTLPMQALEGSRPLEIDANSKDSENSWYEHLWQEVQQLIVIKKHAAPLQALPTATEEAALRQQLHSLLLQAAWAGLGAEQELYISSLEAALERLDNFDASLPEVVQFKEQLIALSQVELNPELPSLQASQEAIKAYKQQQEELENTENTEEKVEEKENTEAAPDEVKA